MSGPVTRPRFVTTMAEETIAALGRVKRETEESAGRILDAAMTHAHACRCPICRAIAHEKASQR